MKKSKIIQKTLTIIIADDNVNVRKSLKNFLALFPNFSIIECMAFNEVINRLKNSKIDIILTDVWLLDGGKDAIEKLILSFPEIKVILQTGNALEVESFARNNRLPLLHEPYDMAELLDIIWRWFPETMPVKSK